MVDFHPKAQTKPTGLEPALETRTEAQRFSPHQVEASIVHRKRHEARGNGFGYVELRGGKPACTLPRSLSLSDKFLHVPTAPRFIEKDGSHWLPSPIELNRIGSFPDAFQFVGNYREQWAYIGNAVPPKLMEAIAFHIYEKLLLPSMQKEGGRADD